MSILLGAFFVALGVVMILDRRRWAASGERHKTSLVDLVPGRQRAAAVLFMGVFSIALGIAVALGAFSSD